mgnify:CR=1 FL=1
MPEHKTIGQLMEEMRLKAGAQNCGQHDVDIVKMIKLAVQCRSGQSNQVWKFCPYFFKFIPPAPLGVVRTVFIAFSAVDAVLGNDESFSVPDPDRLRRTPFQAGKTPAASVCKQKNRMVKFVHNIKPS